MAFASLTCPAWLLPWQQAGLHYVLAPYATHSLLQQTAPDAGPRSAPLPPRRPAPAPPQHDASDAAAGASNRPPAAAISPPPGGAAPDARPAFASLPHAEWPLCWQELFAKSAPAPVLWTYHSLGFDLLGQGDAARGAVFRRMFAALSLPKGSSGFWPTALPDGAATSALSASSAVFWSGVSLLQPKLIAVFGEVGLADIGIDAKQLPRFQHMLVGGRMVIHLPDVAAFSDNEPLFGSVISFLRPLVRTVTRTT